MRLSSKLPLQCVARFYIWMIRGTPLLVQIVFLYTAFAAANIFARASGYIDEALRWIPQAPPAQAATASKLRVLVVDDNADMRDYLMRVLREFHDAVGRLVKRFDATVGFLEGDGVQLFFNDPVAIPDAPMRAVRLGCALREEMAVLTPVWQKRGYDLEAL